MTMMQKLSLTLEEFLKQPETKPASEFINGCIYQKPMPQGKHSRLQLKLCNAVNQVAESPKIALAFPELRCTFGGRSIVPDVSVFGWERIPFDVNGEISNLFDQKNGRQAPPFTSTSSVTARAAFLPTNIMLLV